MERLLAKIRNKKLKGNISLLVIIILLASSVISLLSINQIQRLITYGNQTFNYFRAFYLAKAGTELGLTEVYHRGDGFDNRVETGSYIVTGNLLPEYSGFNPYFDMTITGSFSTLTNDIRNSCSGNKIRLASGAGIMLSLFDDGLSNSNDINEILSDKPLVTSLQNNNIFKLELEDIHWEGGSVQDFTFGLFDFNNNGEMSNLVVKTGNNLNSFLRKNINSTNSNRWYLTIKNPSTGNEIAEFCITMGGDLIPYSDSLITVFGHYGNMEVGIQSVVRKGVPDWSLNVIY